MAYVYTVERANAEDEEIEFDDELEEVSDVEDLLAELAELVKDEGIGDDVASLDGNLRRDSFFEACVGEPVKLVPKEPDVQFVPKGIVQIYMLDRTEGIDFGDKPQIIDIILR